MVAALMHFDMLTWQEKDLGWIARKMDNIQRRLDLKRGGKQTQKHAEGSPRPPRRDDQGDREPAEASQGG